MNESRTLYSPLKAFRFPGHLQALAERRVAAPVHVRIKPTNACGHDCWFCAYRADGLALGEQMSVRDGIPRDKMLELCNDLTELGVRAVTFSGGGEPLIYPHFAEAVSRLGGAGLRVGALTNGSNLRGDAADALASRGTWVRVSIDGWDGPSLARSRRVSEREFDRVLGHLRAFAARRSPCELGAVVIVTRENHAHLPGLFSDLKGAGVRQVKVSAVVVSNEGEETARYHEPIRDAVRAALESSRSRLEDAEFRLLDHYHGAEQRFDKGYAFCPYLQFLTVIGADLAVYSCQDKAYTEGGRLGSIRDRRFREFWFSEENRRRLYSIDPSRDCRHHCVTHAKNLMLHEYLSLAAGHAEFV